MKNSVLVPLLVKSNIEESSEDEYLHTILEVALIRLETCQCCRFCKVLKIRLSLFTNSRKTEISETFKIFAFTRILKILMFNPIT